MSEAMASFLLLVSHVLNSSGLDLTSQLFWMSPGVYSYSLISDSRFITNLGSCIQGNVMCSVSLVVAYLLMM